jgi:hypothetical protein
MSQIANRPRQVKLGWGGSPTIQFSNWGPNVGSAQTIERALQGGKSIPFRRNII